MSDAAPTSAWRPASLSPARSGLRRTGLVLLGYTIFVLLFGALVRVTGSGAGCGQHWPTCQGEIAHLPRSLETLLELSHRLTSGLLLLAAAAFAWLLHRRLPRGHRAKKAMLLGLGFTLIDALIGAVLVLGALVGQNTSALRALVMPAHLISSCGLTAGFALAAFWAEERRDPLRPGLGKHVKLTLYACLAGFFVVSAMGAITALGDTLYPVQGGAGAARLLQDQGATAHFLERLRVVHPLLAVAFGLLVAGALPRVTESYGPSAQRFARATTAVVVLQLLVGLLNVWLGAPGWMQLLHLTAAIALWLGLVFTTAEVIAPVERLSA